MSEYNGISGTENGFDFEQLNTLSNGGSVSSKIGGSSSQTRLLSYLGRVIYDYSGKYFATASMRSDGSYLFAPGMRRGEFYSGSLAWKVNEDFFKDVKQLDLMKVRIGWGQTGNSNIGGGFQYLDKISDASNFSPVFGDNQLTTRAMYTLYSIASKTIQWETAEMINFGIDINLFNSKLQTSAEYYVKNNTDLLVQVPISMAFGRSTDAGKPWFNSGNIQNKGVELSLQWRDKIKDFNYGITSSFTTINNKVKYLPVPYISGTNNQTIVGNSIGALYGYVADGIVQVSDFTSSVPDAKGIYSGYKYPSQSGFTPQPGDIKYQDLNDDGTVDANDRTIIGKTIPKFTYTLGFDCSYKNFDLNLFLFGVNDFNIYNAQRASLSSMKSNDNDFNKLNDFALNHWTLANASTTHVRVDESNANHNDQISSFWIEDGSFLRIKDFQIGYNATPKMCKNLGVGSFRVYVNASNLYNFTSYKGRDPEGFISSDPTSSGTDNGGYTLPKSYTFGLQVGF
jgi:TonB-linked SusC/RagA family outer membrane protein